MVENLALRQQLAILTAKRPRPRMRAADRLFWVALRRLWPRWKEALVIIRPDTVVRWHREGFRKYWTWKSRHRRVGRPSTDADIRALVDRMAAENPTRGAPRIHGELLMLGFDVSERTVSRWMPRRPADPEARQRWRNFLRNHREVLAAIDRMGIRRKQITPYSPWQNGAAERWVQTVRRDLLDHVIVLNERHLQRLLSELVAYYHDDRTHLGLSKSTPSMRMAASKPTRGAEIAGHQRIGGLHHRYEWGQAA